MSLPSEPQLSASSASAAPYVDGLGRVVDLDNCALEPIQFPGAIQPHGCLLVLFEADLTIVQVSKNVDIWLGLPAEALLGKRIEAFLEAGDVQLLQRALLSERQTSVPLKLSFHAGGQKADFDATMYRLPSLVLIEFEPVVVGTAVDYYQRVRQTMARLRLQNVRSPQVLFEQAAAEVRALAGFDRVMIYRFDRDWNGEVVGEAVRPGMEPFLGLHYPASDIPAQARELYRRNWLRLIPDATYQPVPLVPVFIPLSGAPIDLSALSLRSVSSIHLEYLQNMGVRASMSISLITDGRLWGLIACHHETPHFMPPAGRTACEIVGQIVSQHITDMENSEALAYKEGFSRLHRALRQHAEAGEDLVAGLVKDHPAAALLLEAAGGCVFEGKTVHRIGDLPDDTQLVQLADWVETQFGDGDLYATDALPLVFQQAIAYKELASGLLAIRLSRSHRMLMLWVRPEVLQTVAWGGNPEKPVELHEHGTRISPRKSFAAWQQRFGLHSKPWNAAELASVAEYRSLLVSLIATMRERHAVLRLQALDQLKSDFLAAVSHNLRTPLNFITAFASILEDELDGPLNEAQHQRLAHINVGADQLLVLIDNLLDFAHMEAGTFGIVRHRVLFDEIGHNVLKNIAAMAEEQGVKLVSNLAPACTVEGDPVRLGQVLYNLLSNAVKFTQAEGTVELHSRKEGSLLRIEVRDTGRGIEPEDCEQVFDKFFQADDAATGKGKQTAGSGLGLAIAKALVESHGGDIGVGSEPGQGTTFWFTLALV